MELDFKHIQEDRDEEEYEDSVFRDPEEVADENGQIVVYPAKNECQLDIDSEEHLKRYKERLSKLRDYFPMVKAKQTPSRQKGHYHVTLQFSRDLTMWQRIALQAVLGSDERRELLNCIRALNGDKNPTRLFEDSILKETPPCLKNMKGSDS